MVNRVGDLMWLDDDWDGHADTLDNAKGFTGIMFDSCVEDEEGNLLAVGDLEIEMFLNKELAEACNCSVDEIIKTIYA